jgi:hypothetical protein
MWSKTKKQLENFICESLKGRIEFFCSNYRMHDGIGRAYITVDGKEVYNMCTLKRDYYRNPKDGEFSQVEFLQATVQYLNGSVQDSLKSDNLLVKLLAILDRRVGKRTLIGLADTIKNEDGIIQYFYKLRCGAENVSLKSNI